MQVNILEAKNTLSKLIRLLEQGEEGSITIARSNKAVAQLTLVEQKPKPKRIGVAKGKALYADDWDSAQVNAQVAQMFGVE